MKGYVDTSVLVKSYVFESRSEEAVELLDRLKAPVPLSPLLRLEFTNALHLKRFREELTDSELERFLQAFEEDIQTGIVRPSRLDSASVFATGVDLSRRWSAGLGSRCLDILHVATAVDLELEIFVTFDQRQGALAREVGLTVWGC